MEDQNFQVEHDFPVSEYYKNHILAGETLTHNGPWWSAVLLIKDPKTQEPFIGAYRWQKTQLGWKVRKRFSFKRKSDVRKVVELLMKYADRLETVPKGGKDD